MPKDVSNYIDSLPKHMAERIKRFIKSHSTLVVADKATVLRIWGMVSLSEQKYYELTQLLK